MGIKDAMKKHLLVIMGATGILGSVAPVWANSLYFAMPINYNQSKTDTVFVYGAPGVTGTTTSPNGFSSAFTVGGSNVASVVIPNSFDLITSGAITNNGFVVSTDNAANKVGASYLSRFTATTDTTYLFDSTALGTSYYALGATNSIG